MTVSPEHLTMRMHEALDNLSDRVRIIASNVPQQQDEWRLQARCRGIDPALFYHPDGERGHARARRSQYAKMVCAECPVVQACRAYSLAFNERFGVWGGLSEEERDVILDNPRDRNRHRALRCGAGRTAAPVEMVHRLLARAAAGERSSVAVE